MAGLEVEGLFTAALGLAEPWKVDKVELNTAKRRIDFEVVNTGARMACPACGAQGQPVHERVRRSWRHLDFFQARKFTGPTRRACARTMCAGAATPPWARHPRYA